MKYDKIEITNVRGKRKYCHKSLLYSLQQYHSNIADTTGLGGTWSGSGHLYDVYQVGDKLVAMSIMNGGYPAHVWNNADEMMKYLLTLTDTVIPPGK